MTEYSTTCPECDLLAIRATQEPGDDVETCECPNGHEWEREVFL